MRLRKRIVFEDLSRPRVGLSEREVAAGLKPKDDDGVVVVLPRQSSFKRAVLLGAIGLAPASRADSGREAKA